MQSIHRPLAVTGLATALILAACGGGTATSAPGTGGAAATPVGTGEPVGATQPPTGGGLGPEDVPAAIIAAAFGGTAPEPECGDMAPSGDFCRWTSADESVVLDLQRDGQFATEEAWREAFGNAGFDEEITDLGIPVIGGTTVLSPGYQAAAYGPDKTSYSVSLSSGADPATVKATVIAVLKAFSGG
jgi:hypothetical protein